MSAAILPFTARPVPATTLAEVETNAAHRVVGLQCPPDVAHWAAWLEEIGFLPGERVSVTVRGLPGGDPLVVRVGSSTFALRRAEAACVRLESVDSGA
jgi:ferrous iron transport protein A